MDRGRVFIDTTDSGASDQALSIGLVDQMYIVSEATSYRNGEAGSRRKASASTRGPPPRRRQ